MKKGAFLPDGIFLKENAETAVFRDSLA